jgi:hypothetical protein
MLSGPQRDTAWAFVSAFDDALAKLEVPTGEPVLVV